VSGWKTLGENVARAGSVSDAHRQFMTVVSERTNVLGRGYVMVGIGVASFAGRIYVVEVFDDPLVIGPRLAIGSRGSWVKVVQRKLRLRVTGRYTRSTRTAVMRWQQAHALPVTGVVAYRTWCSFRL
jgi:peptidoglycan hydrolase-like protein with peptidoglycan-binding domain